MSRSPRFLVGLAVLFLLHAGPRRPTTRLDHVLLADRVDAARRLVRPAAVTEVALVLIDDRDLREVPSRWPWNRRILAAGLAKIRAAGAAAIGLAAELGLEGRARVDSGQDAVLLEYLRGSNREVYLGGSPGSSLERHAPPPLPEFAAALAGVGSPTPRYDSTGALVGYAVDPGDPEGAGLATLLRLGRGPAAAEGLMRAARRGVLLLPHQLADRTPRIAWRDLDDPKKTADLAGRVVLLGGSAIVMHDLVDTAFRRNMPRAELLGMVLVAAERDTLPRALGPVAEPLGLLLVMGVVLLLAARIHGFGMLLVAAGLVAAHRALGVAAAAWFHLELPFGRVASLILLTTVVELLRQRSEVDSTYQLVDSAVEPEAHRLMDQALSAQAEGDHAEAARLFGEVAGMETILRTRAEQRLVLSLLAADRTAEAAVVAADLEVRKLEEEEIHALAVQLEAHDLKEEAKRCLEQLYLIDPDFEDVRTRLAELRHELAGFTEDELVETIARRVLDQRFEDVRLFAKGGVGFLFLVADRERRRERVALKILSPLLMNDPVVVTRFLREAEAVSRIPHPNIVRVHEVFPRSLPYYTMEYLDAASLEDRQARGERLDALAARDLFVQACAGLGHAHGHGLVHRDVKPGNLLVSDDGVLKVIDFGSAAPLSGEEGARAGAVAGTPLFMAPEQVRGDPPTPAVDIYALGLVMYEALAGELPFDTMQARLQYPAPRLEPSVEVPEAVVDVVMACLEADPAARPGTMKEVAVALREAVPGTSPPRGPGTAPPAATSE